MNKAAVTKYARCHAPMAIVIAVIVVAVMLVLSERWRRGAIVFGVATLFAGGFRLFLPEDQVGLLAVRGKWFDVGALFTIGAAIVGLGLSIDPLGTG